MYSTNRNNIRFNRVTAFILIISMILSLRILSLQSSASTDGLIYDKETNTAFITHKSAKWTEYEQFLAELTLSVNGTQILEPLDVVICLDRSGSMDMNWQQNKYNNNFQLYYGYTAVSCPCLNPEHFYLAPVIREINSLDPQSVYQAYYNYTSNPGMGAYNLYVKYYEKGEIDDAPDFEGWACSTDNESAVPARAALYTQIGAKHVYLENTGDNLGYVNLLASYKNSATGSIVYYDKVNKKWYEFGYEINEPVENADITKGYRLPNGNIAAYKNDYNVWTEVNPKKENLYYQFTEPNYRYIPFHFEETDDGYKLISKWDEDTVFGDTYFHGNEKRGCYDRWMEAKKAISEFSAKLIEKNENNNVALVPFSRIDSIIVKDLNYFKTYRDYILKTNPDALSAATGITSIDPETNELTGSYNSRVGWTNNAANIDNMLGRLFTTANTDYVYGLSMAYNMLQERSAEAKATKKAVVLFISDGVPYIQTATGYIGYGISGGNSVGNMVSFYNNDPTIYALTEFLKRPANEPIYTDELFWDYIKDNYLPNMHKPTPYDATAYISNFLNDETPAYRRHEINLDYLINNDGSYIGAYGKGAQMVTVGYMIEEEYGIDEKNSDSRLKNMATNLESYINIPPTPSGSMEGYLTEELLSTSLFPGGRNAVLRDKISKYFYISEDAELPEGVSWVGTIEDGQTLVWEIGNIYSTKEDHTITVPLVLREEYRNVDQITYYPTNADENPEPDKYDPEKGPDGPDTGAKLYYTDPEDNERYDTIGTPKLEVLPPAPTGTADASISGTKSVVGWNGEDQTYYFSLIELTDNNPNNIKSGSLFNNITSVSGSGVFGFNLTELEAGSYWFKVTETDSIGGVITDSGGWTYSKNVMIVKIDVVDNKQGGYKADVIYSEDSANRIFINSYAAEGTANAAVSGSKSVVGWTGSDQTYYFALTELIDNNPLNIKTGSEFNTVTSVTGNGTFNFNITGLESGTYWFKVTESNSGGSVLTDGNGWIYSKNIMVVKIDVFDNGQGSYDSIVTYPENAENRLFINSYESTGTADAIISGTKSVVGWTGPNQTYYFTISELSDNNPSNIIEGSILNNITSVRGSGAFNFNLKGLESGTYWFKITETDSSGNTLTDGNGWVYSKNVMIVKIEVTDNGKGGFNAEVAYQSDSSSRVFINSYAAEGTASTVINGTKSVVGWTGNEQTYYFSLRELIDSNPNNVRTESRFNSISSVIGNGSFSFDLTELESGTYWFKVTETDSVGNVLADTKGWTYSKNVMIIKIEVTDNRQGSYEAVVTYLDNAENRVFINTYVQPVASVIISGNKITNANAPNSTFTFELIQVANAQGADYLGTPITRTASINGTGEFVFEPIEGLTEGIYYFSFKETVGGGKGWVNDTETRIITVTVAGDPLKAEYSYTTGNSTFNNNFTPEEIGIILTGTKTVTGGTLIPGQFNFAVYENGSLISIGTNMEGGIIRFNQIRYKTTGVYTYTVRETSLSNNNWTVDDTVYIVTVTVTSNSDGSLSAAVEYPSGGIVFNNIYTYVPPVTPPDDNITLSIRKVLVDADGNVIGDGKKFAVRLYDAQMNFVGRYTLSANGESVVIGNLESGSVYYLQEEIHEGYDILNFEIIGIGFAANSAVGLRIPTYTDTLNIEIIITNEAYNLIEIPDEEEPLSPYEPPEEPIIIDVPEEETPLKPPPTSDNSITTIGIKISVAIASSLFLTNSVKKRKKNRVFRKK